MQANEVDIGVQRLLTYARTVWAKDIHIVAATGWGQDEDRRHSKDADLPAKTPQPSRARGRKKQ